MFFGARQRAKIVKKNFKYKVSFFSLILKTKPKKTRIKLDNKKVSAEIARYLNFILQ